MWLRDFHVDGLRLDAVHALRRRRARPTCSRSWPSRSRRSSTHVGPAAVADRRVRPQRPAAGHRARGRRLRPARRSGPTTSTTPARRAHRRARRATTPTSPPPGCRPRARADPGVPPRRHLVELPAAQPRRAGRPPPHPRATGSSPTCRTTTRSATAPTGDRLSRDRSPPGCSPAARRCVLTLAVHADALHGRGVGRAHAVAVLHRLPRRRRCATAVPDGPQAEFAEHGWGDADVPDPDAERPSSTPSWTGRSAERGAARDAAARAPRADRAAPGVRPSCPTRGSTTSRWTSTTRPARSCCTAAGCGWCATSAASPSRSRSARSRGPAGLGAGGGRRARRSP